MSESVKPAYLKDKVLFLRTHVKNGIGIIDKVSKSKNARLFKCYSDLELNHMYILDCSRFQENIATVKHKKLEVEPLLNFYVRGIINYHAEDMDLILQICKLNGEYYVNLFMMDGFYKH